MYKALDCKVQRKKHFLLYQKHIECELCKWQNSNYRIHNLHVYKTYPVNNAQCQRRCLEEESTADIATLCFIDL